MAGGRLALASILALLVSVSRIAASTSETQSGTAPSAAATAEQPRWIQFSGRAADANGKTVHGTVGITFAIYKDQQGGNPLWLETQNVAADEQGSYSVLLGHEHEGGLPSEIFSSREARWLGIQLLLPGEVEQPRLLLVNVPYALKAGDADTLGGMPLSAFILRGSATAGASSDSDSLTASGAEGSAADSTREGLQIHRLSSTHSDSTVYSGTAGEARIQDLNNVRYANQFPGDDAGSKIGAAIADCPATGCTVDARGFEGAQAFTSTLLINKPVKLLLGKATFTMTGGNSELIRISSSGVEIGGSGWDSVLQVGVNVGVHVDAIRVAGTEDLIDLNFHDFAIRPEARTPGRYGINFDNSVSYTSYVVMSRIYIGTLGSYAIAVTNPGPLPNGGMFTTTLEKSYISGGIDLENAGDSVRIINNTITGPRGLIINNVRGRYNQGAHGTLLGYNNITSAGNIRVINGTQTQIIGNNIEATMPSTSPNNALIDIDGTADSRVASAVISGNFVGANSLYVGDGIRVNYADGTVIRDNLTIRGSGKSYNVTAHATNTQIRGNREEPYGELSTTFLSDAGRGTTVEFNAPVSGAMTRLGDISLGTLDSSSPKADSSSVVFAGHSNGGGSSTPEWRLFNNVTSDAGTSNFTIQNRADGGDWASALAVGGGYHQP